MRKDKLQQWRGVLRPVILSRPFMSRLSDISSFPFEVCDLKQGDVVFEAYSIEVIERKVAFHRLPKVLDSHIKAS